jgi:hypothetical protein
MHHAHVRVQGAMVAADERVEARPTEVEAFVVAREHGHRV